MRPEELMIGDYAQVNRDGLCINKDTIVEIREIDANNTFNTHIGSASCRPLDDMQYENGIWCDDLSPIPLTTEILVKNGFIYDPNSEEEDDGWWEWRNFGVESGNEYVNIAFRDDDVAVYDLEILKGSSAMNFHFDYVHELQHVLRLCGIDKEIML